MSYDEDEELNSTTDNDELTDENEGAAEGGFDAVTVDLSDESARRQLRGMYQSWYLDYASYTILDRAIPHIDDGLKPVQRRILHSMKTLDDGRFNKVANIVGNTMQYHPMAMHRSTAPLWRSDRKICWWRPRQPGQHSHRSVGCRRTLYRGEAQQVCPRCDVRPQGDPLGP